MSKIEEFLTKFDDQHLANLQCAAEDGTLIYHDCNKCLLHHFRGDYSVTKWESEYAVLAREAEVEYRLLGPTLNPFLGFTKAVERERRKAILPLIHAEWARRRNRPVDIIQTGSLTIEWTEEEVVPAETTPQS